MQSSLLSGIGLGEGEGFTEGVGEESKNKQEEHAHEHHRHDQELIHRCKNCNKLLGKESSLTAVIEVKCVRCGEINAFLRNDLAQFFDHSMKKVYLADQHSKILFVNDAVFSINGFTPEDVIGKTPAIWGRQMSNDFYINLYQQIQKEKKSVAVNVVNMRKSGEKYHAIVQISPILDIHGEIEYFLGIETEVKDSIAKSNFSVQ